LIDQQWCDFFLEHIVDMAECFRANLNNRVVFFWMLFCYVIPLVACNCAT
jgi:hypothetical protein